MDRDTTDLSRRHFRVNSANATVIMSHEATARAFAHAFLVLRFLCRALTEVINYRPRFNRAIGTATSNRRVSVIVGSV